MLKIFIGILFIYLNPIYKIDVDKFIPLITNIIGLTLILLGSKSIFSKEKNFKKYFLLYIILLLLFLGQIYIFLFDIKLYSNILFGLQIILIFLPLYFITYTLMLIKKVDTYLKITDKLILTNTLISIILFFSIILTLLNINIQYISVIILYLLKIYISLNFFKLIVYYEP